MRLPPAAVRTPTYRWYLPSPPQLSVTDDSPQNNVAGDPDTTCQTEPWALNVGSVDRPKIGDPVLGGWASCLIHHAQVIDQGVVAAAIAICGEVLNRPVCSTVSGLFEVVAPELMRTPRPLGSPAIAVPEPDAKVAAAPYLLSVRIRFGPPWPEISANCVTPAPSHKGQ